jgi:hypothetical protein
MLHRLLDRYPEDFWVPFAHELLAEAYRANGDFALAEHHLRRCLATMPASRSGTTGLADGTLAEVLVEGGDRARFGEAAALLDASDLASHLVFHAQMFRYYLVRARLVDRVGASPVGVRPARAPGRRDHDTAVPAVTPRWG